MKSRKHNCKDMPDLIMGGGDTVIFMYASISGEYIEECPDTPTVESGARFS